MLTCAILMLSVLFKERFGNSFVVEQFVSQEESAKITSAVAAAPWWVPVDLSDWKHPEGRCRNQIYCGSPRICSRSLMGGRSTPSVFSRLGGRQACYRLFYADVRAILMTSSQSKARTRI